MLECGTGSEAMASVSPEPPFEDRQLVKWIEDQSLKAQELIAIECLNHFLEKAAQPRHTSGNACIKLCYFVEECRSSKSSVIRGFAFCESTCLDLFKFYIEWNEKNQNRSMRQVLELLSSLIARNPDAETASAMKTAIAERTTAIITHQAAQPLVKPAFKCLEYLVGKSTIPAHTLIRIYDSRKRLKNGDLEFESLKAEETSWDNFIHEIFEWMVLPDISPAAGKFLVTIFRALKDQRTSSESPKDFYSASWQRWISKGLEKNPDALENVKNHLFPPLFKLDRAGSVVFLKDLNSNSQAVEVTTKDAGAHALLRLSAMEMGKKSGLIEEPATLEYLKTAKKASSAVVLAEDTLKPLVLHSSDTVRSLAFSLLVSSLSSTRPFSFVALEIFRSCMDVLYSDPDAKFRNEVLSNTKHMIERLRGATSLMAREVENLSYRPREDENQDKSLKQKQENLRQEVAALLQAHQAFIAWYLEFLLGELIPTASYQRHITALKAAILLLHSGIDNSMSQPIRHSGNATAWPFAIHFFTPGVVRLVMDLLLDPFEDVRSTAADILRLASPACFDDNIDQTCFMPMHDVQRTKELANVTDTMTTNASECADNGDDIGRTSVEKVASDKEHNKHENKRTLGVLLDFIENAKALSRQTGRADYADGLARSFELLYGLQPSTDTRTGLVSQLIHDLEEKIQIAENNLGQAVLGAPIHGNFAALRFIWDSSAFARHNSDQKKANSFSRTLLNDLQSRIITSCTRIWGAVKEILCNDSPEGHLLEDLEDIDVDVVDTKNILSYSFRAVHESSNLLRSVVAKRKVTGPDGSPLIPLDLFEEVGDLTFDQLSNLRHRGAFSTVTLTFATCCALTQYKVSSVAAAPHAPNSTYLEKWYKQGLSCIKDQASTTRRSAGIPAIFTAIMSARSQQVPFGDTMKELMKISWQEVAVTDSEATNIPQVHSLNSLREAFKSSSIGALCEPYIGEALRLTVHCLRSQVWAIRNCGLLLFRSLIDLLLGTSVGKAEIEHGWDGRSTKIQYERYPELEKILIELLAFPQALDEPYQPEIVLPALDIIRRAGPPDGEDFDHLFQLVVAHLKCPIWHVREMAARALCSLTMGGDLVSRIRRVLANPEKLMNFRHGCLLAAKCIIERESALDAASVAESYQEIIAIWQEQWNFECASERQSLILAELLHVRNAMLSTALAASKSPAAFDDLSPEDFRAYYQQAKEMLRIPVLFQAYMKQFLLLAALNKAPSMIEFAITHLEPDTAEQMLEILLENFGSGIEFADIVAMYGKIYRNQEDSDVRAKALSCLSQTLERHYTQNLPQEVRQAIFETVLDILISTKSSPVNTPSFRNAHIRFSGWFMLFKLLKIDGGDAQAKDELSSTFIAWATMLKTSGEASKDYDTRLAAIKAVGSVFSHIKVDNTANPELLSIHLILYDALNDDDSDIREIGARIVSVIAKMSFVALAASRWLTQELLLPSYGSSPHFIWHVICKMTGTNTDIYKGPTFLLLPVAAQLNSAFVRDAQLFAAEKENLYIDEVREVDLWTEIFKALPKQNEVNNAVSSLFSDFINVFLDWTIEGLTTVNRCSLRGFRYRWDSDPSTFIVYARLISCCQALLSYLVFIKTEHGGTRAPKSAYSMWSEKLLKMAFLLDEWETLALKQHSHASLLKRLYAEAAEGSLRARRSPFLVPLIAPIAPIKPFLERQQRNQKESHHNHDEGE